MISLSSLLIAWFVTFYRGPTDLNQFRHKITKPQKLEKYTLILPLIPPKQKKKLTGRRVNEEKTSLYPT